MPCPLVSVFVWKRNFFFSVFKTLCVHSYRFRPSTRIRWIDLKTITYPTAHAWRIRVHYYFHRRKMSTHALQKWYVIYFGQCHWLWDKNAREMLAMAAFFGSDRVTISCLCKRSKIILVKVLMEVCSLENKASWKWRKIAVAWSDSMLLTLRSLVCMWKKCRKWMKRRVIVTLFVYCMFRATRYKKKL